jgi:microcystin degradation protein MlrC
LNVLIAGFQHETNSFSPGLTDWNAFNEGAGRPGAVTGAAALTTFGSLAVPARGFFEFAIENGWHARAGLWCCAEPAGLISGATYERICASILEECTLELDAIYLDLHGAAMAQGHPDAEGELLRRIRAKLGHAVPIIASLDLHANVTRAMLELADALVAFRTHPHVDQVQTGRRAGELLRRRLRRGRREPMAWARLSYLISATAMPTTGEPAGSIYRKLEAIDNAEGTISSFCMAFPASDFAECGPVVWTYGERCDESLNELLGVVDEPVQWRRDALPIAEAVERALERARHSSRPVVLADTQDNPGAGGTGNTTGAVRALLAAGAGRAHPGQVAVAMLFDPDSAREAFEAGVGATVQVELGESVPVFDGYSDDPVRCTVKVRAVSGGEVVFQGPKNHGFRAQLGPTACLETEGVLIVVTSQRVAAQDREQFRMVGIHPEDMKILVVKSSNHFRADFEPLVEDPSTDVIVAKAKGSFAVDPGDLPWKNLPATMRTRP